MAEFEIIEAKKIVSLRVVSLDVCHQPCCAPSTALSQPG
jgi:hypothetical protein